MSNYKRISDRIEELIIDNPRTEEKLKWVNIINAGKNGINFLRKNYNFNLTHLKSAAASVSFQRPQIFKDPDYLFLILHFPVLKDDKIIAGEIDFFIGHGFLISITKNNLKDFIKFFDLGKKSPDSLVSFSLESSAILLYEILEHLLNGCYNILDDISIDLNEIEELIFSGKQKEAVTRILTSRRNVINIRKIMQNHKNILKQLMGMESSLVERQIIKRYYADLVEHTKRIWETLDNQKEMIEVLYNTNESLLNNRMTNIMKTLTIFSVIVFPLSLTAEIFGMNTEYMPFVGHPFGFWIIIILMSCASLLMLLIFERKKWLR